MKKCAAIAIFFFLACSAAAYAGIITKGTAELAEEVAAKLFKTGGQAAAEEIAEYGGKKALKETIENVAEKYGENAAKKFVAYGERFGIKAIKVMELNPKLYINAFDSVPESLIKKAVWAAERDPEAMTGLVKKYGPDALEVAARQRGTGIKILEALGKDGIKLSRALTEKQGVTLAKNAEDIARLSAGNREKIIKKILSAPRMVIDYLEKHPKTLRTTAGVGVILSLKSEFTGQHTVIKYPDGRIVETSTKGLFSPITDILRPAVKLIGFIFTLFFALYLIMRMFFFTRYQALKHRMKTAYLREEFTGKKI